MLQQTDTLRDTRTRVVVAETQSLFREALRKALVDMPDISIVGEAADRHATADVVTRVAPDVLLVDSQIGWPVTHAGSDLVDPPVVVLAEDENLESLVNALEAGASGFVAKRRPLPELIEAIRSVRVGEMAVPEGLRGPLIRHLLARANGRLAEPTRGRTRSAELTQKEREVLSLLGRRVDNGMIAEELQISPKSARTHVQNILSKLRAESPTEAAAVARDEGILPAEAPTNTSVGADAELRVVHRPVEGSLAARLDGEKSFPVEKRVRATIRRYELVGAGLALSDAGSLMLTFALTKWLVAPRATVFSPLLALDLALWLCVFHLFGLYTIQHLSASEEFRKIISATGVGIAGVAVATSWVVPTLTRSWISCAWAFALVLHLAQRRIWRRAVYALRCRGWLAYRTLIVGTNPEARNLAETLTDPSFGFLPVGHVSTSDGTFESDELPVVSHISTVDGAIRDCAIECVFVASTAVDVEQMFRVTRACRRANVEMRVSANLPEILTSRVAIQHMDRVMALSVRPVRLTRTQSLVKRSFDVVLATGALVVLAPLIAVLAALVALASGRPVFFGQRRVTKNGRVFTLFKLRTMVTDQEGRLADRVIDLTQPFFKLDNDPRLTGIGRILRMWSLDELPQLWNVVRGHMSLVGPRPLPIEQVGANAALLAPRQEVRAGITGWWQIQGRGVARPEEALEMDLFYIENWSLYLDLYILLKTVGKVLHRDGAA